MTCNVFMNSWKYKFHFLYHWKKLPFSCKVVPLSLKDLNFSQSAQALEESWYPKNAFPKSSKTYGKRLWTFHLKNLSIKLNVSKLLFLKNYLVNDVSVYLVKCRNLFQNMISSRKLRSVFLYFCVSHPFRWRSHYLLWSASVEFLHFEHNTLF